MDDFRFSQLWLAQGARDYAGAPACDGPGLPPIESHDVFHRDHPVVQELVDAAEPEAQRQHLQWWAKLAVGSREHFSRSARQTYMKFVCSLFDYCLLLLSHHHTNGEKDDEPFSKPVVDGEKDDEPLFPFLFLWFCIQPHVSTTQINTVLSEGVQWRR